MKKIILCLAVVIFFGSLNSCCRKNPYQVGAVKLVYSNLSTPHKLKAIRTESNNLSSLVDTIYIGELNASNFYSNTVLFNDELLYSYVVYVENTAHIDTISDIVIERKKGCKEEIKNLEYKFNGEPKSENTITID